MYERACVVIKSKTEYEMRISDWSSDLCSSDLTASADAVQQSGTRPPEGRPPEGQPPEGRPNVILILSDDEDLAIHRYRPKTKALLEDQGARFDNYFVTYSLCCPSRATTLRGQYSHNHRIQGNVLPSGGGHKFRTLGHDQSTIATWLHDAGYRTGLIGKYMNQYEPDEQTYIRSEEHTSELQSLMR